MYQIEGNEIRDFGNLELLARQVVEGFIIGLHKSPFHGFSVEFAEHRLYNPGDSTKNIDWKVYARTDKLFIKRFEEETNLRCQIVIDTSSSMYFPEINPKKNQNINKIRFSALAAASLMNLLMRQRDAFGLTLFDKEVVQHTHTKGSNTHYRLLLSYLDQVINTPEQGKTTSTAEALHQIADSIHKRSMVVIFSDMFEDKTNHDQLFSALQHLKHNKHEVVLFHVADHSKEIDFNFDNRPYRFVDMESGEEVRLQPQEIKEVYKQQVSDYLAEIKLKCLQYKIDFVEADIAKNFGSVLQAYLVKRTKMRI